MSLTFSFDLCKLIYQFLLLSGCHIYDCSSILYYYIGIEQHSSLTIKKCTLIYFHTEQFLNKRENSQSKTFVVMYRAVKM